MYAMYGCTLYKYILCRDTQWFVYSTNVCCGRTARRGGGAVGIGCVIKAVMVAEWLYSVTNQYWVLYLYFVYNGKHHTFHDMCVCVCLYGWRPISLEVILIWLLWALAAKIRRGDFDERLLQLNSPLMPLRYLFYYFRVWFSCIGVWLEM